MITIDIELEHTRYPVYLGRHGLDREELWAPHLGDGRVLVVRDVRGWLDTTAPVGAPKASGKPELDPLPPAKPRRFVQPAQPKAIAPTTAGSFVPLAMVYFDLRQTKSPAPPR